MRTELHPKGLEIVTVCLDMAGAEAARPFIEAAHARHPSLIDVDHRVDALFGVTNIPNALWIDEQGVIVRPAEPAWPGPRPEPQSEPRPPAGPGSDAQPQPAQPHDARPHDARPHDAQPHDAQPHDTRPQHAEPHDTGTDAAPAPEAAPALPDRVRQMLAAVGRSKVDRTRYAPAVRDWAEHGAASRWALAPDEVVRRSQPRGADEAAGAAHFELARRLWDRGHLDSARRHFGHAHRLQPDNWTFKRQAWSVEPSPVGAGMQRLWQGPVEGREADWPYEGDFLADVAALGDRDYYPVPADMRN